MKGWLLDTNVISALIGPNPEPRIKAWAASQPEHTFRLSILTFGEFQKGLLNLPPGHKLRQKIQHTILGLESRFAGRILAVSDEIVLRWGGISGEAKRVTGHSPSVIDTMLAATAIEHQLYLATRNTIHVAHSGAAVFNPWKDDSAHFPLL